LGRTSSKGIEKPEPMPRHVTPMLAMLSVMPAGQDDYAFEYKWDGIRAVYFAGADGWRLETRNLKDVTVAFPELGPLHDRLGGTGAVLDGEVVALDRRGEPSFSLLQHRLGVVDAGSADRLSREIPVTYMIFDLLYREGRGLMGLPYEERRRLLEEESLAGPRWQTPPSNIGEGDAMLEAARSNHLEGVVAKRLGSPYRPGERTRDWLKVKLVKRQEFVVGGWVPLSTGAPGLGSILVGYYEDVTDGPPRLVYAGKVGTGFNDAERDRLQQMLGRIRRQDSPFSEVEAVKGASFAEPELVAEVEFRGWTGAHRLRQPSYKGLRPDKDAAQVVLEEEA
jgi:bifunctional non-homologous end joining protein LigD